MSMNSGKLLKISDERSIYILENEDGSYINKQELIRYRNIGASFEIAQIEEAFTMIDPNQTIHILDNSGKSKFHFPLVWLDTITMKVIELQELGILQINKK
jgi:hypothetical protein